MFIASFTFSVLLFVQHSSMLLIGQDPKKVDGGMVPEVGSGASKDAKSGGKSK